MRNKVLIGILLVLGIGGTYLGIHGKSQVPSTSTVLTTTIAKGDVVLSASATGQVVDEFTYSLTPGSASLLSGHDALPNPTSGAGSNAGASSALVATHIYVHVGDSVTKGEVLARFDTATAAQAVTAASDSLKAANLNYSNSSNAVTSAQAAKDAAQATYEATVLADAAGSTPQTQADVASANSALTKAKSDLSNAKSSAAAQKASTHAQVIKARADLTAAKLSLTQTTITAPASGVVRSISATEGAVTSGSAITLGAGRILVPVMVSEFDVSTIQTGQKVSLTFTALKSTETGTVVEVGQIPDSSSGVKQYQVVIAPDATPKNIRIGMSVSATIQEATATGVLYVPNSAIATIGDISTVQIVDATGAKSSVEVTLGLVGDINTEITSGLNVGDKVFTGTVGAIPSTGNPGFRRGGAGGGFPGGPAG